MSPSKLVSGKASLKMSGYNQSIKWAVVLLVLINSISLCRAALSSTPAPVTSAPAASINTHRILDSLAATPAGSCSSVHDLFEKRGVNKQEIPTSTKGKILLILINFGVYFTFLWTFPNNFRLNNRLEAHNTPT